MIWFFFVRVCVLSFFRCENRTTFGTVCIEFIFRCCFLAGLLSRSCSRYFSRWPFLFWQFCSLRVFLVMRAPLPLTASRVLVLLQANKPVKLGKFFVICSVRVVIIVVKAGMFVDRNHFFRAPIASTQVIKPILFVPFLIIFVTNIAAICRKACKWERSRGALWLTSSFGSSLCRRVQFVSEYVTWLRVECFVVDYSDDGFAFDCWICSIFDAFCMRRRRYFAWWLYH